ncbi:MAG: hypothetical protein EXR75_06535 [Myxococcales bacterium]|nr:hypothetical protein [Myxococcales bacterium]
MSSLLRSISFALVLSLGGCADPATLAPPTADDALRTHTAGFSGSVFDGAVGERLLAYAVEARVGATVYAGVLDAAGQFRIDGIGVWDDYTIAITAEGYRPFLSHNARVGLTSDLSGSDLSAFSTHRELIFDAFLFPTALATKAVTFTVETTVPDVKPAGTMRLRPISSSVLADESVDTPAGVPGQLWSNDEDLQAGVHTESFTGGSFTISAGELIYGVTYRVDIYEVATQQPFQGTYKAGVEADKTFTLTEEVVTPLEVVTANDETCKPPASASDSSGALVLIELNAPAEFGKITYDGGAAEALDDGLSISSQNTDADSVTNQLRPDTSSSLQERVTAVLVNGNKITLIWNPSSGLEPKDPDDTITAVFYSGLSNITLRRPGYPSTQVTLAQLLNKNTIVCD